MFKTEGWVAIILLIIVFTVSIGTKIGEEICKSQEKAVLDCGGFDRYELAVNSTKGGSIYRCFEDGEWKYLHKIGVDG